MTTVDLSAQGLLFDLDGTLINSLVVTERAFTKYAHLHSIDPAPIIQSYHGRPTMQILHEFFPPHTHTEEFVRKMEVESAADLDGLSTIAGAKDLVASVPANKWAICTSGMPFLAHPRMNHLGLPIPGVFVTPADITHGKPHPEGYLLAAKRLGTEPRNCIVFEDAQVGIKAGVGSGAVVIGIRSLLTDAELKNAGAQYTVSDMTKVSVFVKDDDSLVVTVDEN